MNHINNFFGQIFKTLKDTTTSALNYLQNLLQNIQSDDFMRDQMQTRLAFVEAAMLVQKEEMMFLEKHMTLKTPAIAAEMDFLEKDLQSLRAEKERLEAGVLELARKSNQPAQDRQFTSFETYQQQLKLWIAQDKPAEVLEKLITDLYPDSTYYNDIVLISAKLTSVNRQKSLSLISLAEYSNLYSNWVYGLLQLIDQLTEEDLKNKNLFDQLKNLN